MDRRPRVGRVLRDQLSDALAVAQAALEGMLDEVVPLDREHVHRALEAVQAAGALVKEAGEGL
ncbi:hypothetical protein EPN52_05340 [bacterium]|nr:MAG: hypothetical protein EPN52_05340 [bacterium]